MNSSNDKVSGEAEFVKRYFKNRPAGVVLDVGANIGNYSKSLLATNPAISIYAFEPHPLTFLKLKENINAENFHAVNAAVGAQTGVLSLYDYQDNDGSSHASLYQDVIENIHNSKAIEHKVNVITLSDFIESNNIDKIALLKIDTEGNELNVLKGVTKQLEAGKISAIHFEFNEMNVASRTYFWDFWDLLPNFDFYRLLPNDMVKIEKYKPVFCEIFAYQNIVAILKS
ncbi:FkbM family methyltransferase [Methylicorpusculum oleiharenae]|uniref:FkbM family methyltransferase n=1 Tax=Methylicorpusculum oleiharenae TaxID=1338687 RepID=UPI001E578A57|nr:FkbM family methyltransferase [Methylicorpusculum oleiharenae]MCD2449762.1 FkbM family methyltransferase [Methylicorpusculum oleiharenae]